MTELAGTPPHYSDSGLNLYKFASGPLSNNSYLLVCPSTNKSILIDVPAEAFAALEAAESTDVQLILITHGHADHTEGYGDIVRALGSTWQSVLWMRRHYPNHPRERSKTEKSSRQAACVSARS